MAAARNVFVCGLHRSGTSLIAGAIGSHPEVASFKDTGAIEQEGQFLQSILPTDNEFGGPGRFAFDPRSHLTENSPLATQANAEHIAAEWALFHEVGRSVFLEKSPPNLLRTRLLQALFPEARFIIVTRHPIPVSLATRKWTRTSPFSLIAHWVRAHALLEEDLPHLRQVLMVSYESFVADPAGALDRIWQFIDLPPYAARLQLQDRNHGYFEMWRARFSSPNVLIPPASGPWRRLRKRLRFATETQRELVRFRFGLRCDARDAVTAFDRAVRGFGYSLTDFSVSPKGR